MNNDLYSTLRELQDANWKVEKTSTIQFNSGSESYDHFRCKCAVGWYFENLGYRVNSEVEMPKGEVDILAYNSEEVIVVECEQNATGDVVRDKINRYVKGQPPRECYLIAVEDLPENSAEAVEWIASQV